MFYHLFQFLIMLSYSSQEFSNANKTSIPILNGWKIKSELQIEMIELSTNNEWKFKNGFQEFGLHKLIPILYHSFWYEI